MASQPTAESTDAPETMQTQVEAAAVSFVRQWMTTSTETAEALYAQMVARPTMQVNFPDKAPKPASLVEPAAIRATEKHDVWVVTVHAQGGTAGVGEWYSVPVQATQDKDEVVTTGILALPARAATPRRAETAKRSSLETISLSNPAAVTAAGYLTAWLSQSPTVTRWSDPSFTPEPMTTQPCKAVHVISVGASSADAEKLNELAVPVAANMEAYPGAADQSSAASPSAEAFAEDAAVTLQVVASCATSQATRPGAYTMALTQNSGQWAVQSVS